MDYINNKGEKIGSLDIAISNDKKRHHQPPQRCHDRHRPRPQHGQGGLGDVLRRFAVRQVSGITEWEREWIKNLLDKGFT